MCAGCGELRPVQARPLPARLEQRKGDAVSVGGGHLLALVASQLPWALACGWCPVERGFCAPRLSVHQGARSPKTEARMAKAAGP